MSEFWRLLDLRKRSLDGPFDEQLVVLRFVPKDEGRGTEHYEVGQLQTEEGRSVFHGNYDECSLLSELRKDYDIWWTPLQKAVPTEVLRRRK